MPTTHRHALLAVPTAVLSVLTALTALAAGADQEAQVPLDQQSSVLRVDRQLEQALHLFAEYPTFREARLFLRPDSSFVLEIYHLEGARTLKERRLLSAAAVDSLRRLVSQRLASARPAALRDRDGRTRFLARTFLLSYGHYSWAVPLAADLDGRPAQVTGLLTGSAGFAVPFLLTRHAGVSQSVASLAAHGGSTGIAHGVLLGGLVLGNGDKVRARAGLTVATSLAGLTAGYAIAERVPMPAGAADAVGWGGDYGMLLALGAVHVGGLLDEDHVRPDALCALAASAAGYWGGWRLSRTGRISRGDADLLALHTALGAGVVPALIHMADTGAERELTAAAIVGSGLGLAAGYRLVAGRDYSSAQTWMAVLGTVGGGLFGGAVNLVAEGDDRLAPVLISTGALAGAWATSLALAGEAQGDAQSSWSLHLRPALTTCGGPALTCGLEFP